MLEKITEKIIVVLVFTYSNCLFSQDNILTEGRKIMIDLVKEPVILFIKEAR